MTATGPHLPLFEKILSSPFLSTNRINQCIAWFNLASFFRQCKIVLRPIFFDDIDNSQRIPSYNGNNNIHGDNNANGVRSNFPVSTPKDLANAIIETVNAGAKVINLSLGLSTSSIIHYDDLWQAYDYAYRNGVIIAAAVGNQGYIGYTSILNHPWVISVAACDDNGQIYSISNIGPSIGKRGVMAPGIDINSALAGGGFTRMSGTSFAVPFFNWYNRTYLVHIS